MSAVIRGTVADVIAVAGDPQQLPTWASGLASGIRLVDGIWTASSPMGPVTIEFAPPNDFGVLDHWVTVPGGLRFFNPMRVVEHPEGAEVIFTLRRLDMTETAFEADAATIVRDLAALRDLVERARRPRSAHPASDTG